MHMQSNSKLYWNRTLQYSKTNREQTTSKSTQCHTKLKANAQFPIPFGNWRNHKINKKKSFRNHWVRGGQRTIYPKIIFMDFIKLCEAMLYALLGTSRKLKCTDILWLESSRCASVLEWHCPVHHHIHLRGDEQLF